jgi:spoIIIJ-associated protein
MDDHNQPQPNDGPQYGQRRRAGRGGAPAGRRSGPPRPAPEARFERPRPPAAATPEPESVKPARALLEEILVKMGVASATVAYYERPEGEYFEVRGSDLANLIGRHGQTLEALNQVFNNIVNAGVRKDRHYFTIDAEGYRARRADGLRSLALQTLERALRERRSIELEPMLPSERKIIHLALANNEFVATESTGVEPERRVVVIPRGAGAAAP